MCLNFQITIQYSQYKMITMIIYDDEDLLALVLDGDHDHVGLMDQVGGRGEHDHRLSLLEIFLQGVGELFTVLYKFPFPLLQSMFTLCSWNVSRDFIDCIKQFLDSTCNLLDSLKKCFPVCYFIGNSGQNPLEVGTFTVQFLEWFFCSATSIF